MRLWSRDAKRAENSKKLGKVFLFLSFFMFRKAHKTKPILIKTEFFAPFHQRFLEMVLCKSFVAKALISRIISVSLFCSYFRWRGSLQRGCKKELLPQIHFSISHSPNFRLIQDDAKTKNLEHRSHFHR